MMCVCRKELKLEGSEHGVNTRCKLAEVRRTEREAMRMNRVAAQGRQVGRASRLSTKISRKEEKRERKE